MQKTTTAILSITIAAVTIGFLATNGMLPTTFMVAQDTAVPKATDSMGLLGHVTYVVRGPDGNIKSYVQTDNTKTVTGATCALNALFSPGTVGASYGNTTCPIGRIQSGGSFGGFNFVGIMNQTSGKTITINGSDTVGTSKIGGTRVSGNHGIIYTANQGSPLQCTPAGAAYNSITCTPAAFTFTGDSSGGTTIAASALLNSSSTSGTMYAENQISPTVTVGNADTLTVTWTITLS